MNVLWKSRDLPCQNRDQHTMTWVLKNVHALPSVEIFLKTNIEYNLFDLDTYNIFIRTKLFILIQNLAI